MYPKLFQSIFSTIDIVTIINYINDNIQDFGQLSTDNYWGGRTMFFDSIKDNVIKKLIIQNVKYSIDQIKPIIDSTLYCEHLSIARWPKGYDLQPHADAENPQGCPKHPYPWRDFACITFLNNDFDGGILYFPNQNIEIIPQPGKSIIFPGSLKYLHGVTKILKGNRYTIASFLTYDTTKSSISLI